MFKAVTNPPDFSVQAPAIANKPTSRRILIRVISDNISAEKKSKWQKAKYHALLRLMAVSNHQIGTLDLPHLVINQVTLPQKFNFRGANLRCSELKQVTMTAVNLRQSDLSHANMARCPMKRANLRHATLYHTPLENAYL
ncbi:pentapeptide repeat-containing protein [Candidatus Sodalis endolongispinus]|uniref:Pentapeptide repeat-containing protein n=1 Tax=Candidatus Sodalis endolongispinus TaxID=2812662 RepID=A0ABS5YFF0_9GAMM|nr:pentapeptide repeat-containing protein [Candidatus Sodalis endolongispinus]MBT9433214.1 pentapeptide repeat-containing protein [Candidatus Sodalis endolongispinus]